MKNMFIKNWAFVFILSSVMVMGCSTTKSVSPITIPVTTAPVVTDVPSKFVSSNILNLSFTYSEPIVQVKNSSDVAFASPTNEKIHIWTSLVKDFNRVSDGLGDWTMPDRVKKLLLSSEDACVVFKDIKNKIVKVEQGELSLPVDVMDQPILCKSQKNNDGSVVLSILGIEYGYEGFDQLDSVILVVRKDDLVVLDSIIPDLMLSESRKTLADFKPKNSDDLNDPLFKKTQDVLLGQYVKAIEIVTPELQKYFKDLQTIASTVESLK